MAELHVRPGSLAAQLYTLCPEIPECYRCLFSRDLGRNFRWSQSLLVPSQDEQEDDLGALDNFMSPL